MLMYMDEYLIQPLLVYISILLKLLNCATIILDRVEDISITLVRSVTSCSRSAPSLP